MNESYPFDQKKICQVSLLELLQLLQLLHAMQMKIWVLYIDKLTFGLFIFKTEVWFTPPSIGIELIRIVYT